MTGVFEPVYGQLNSLISNCKWYYAVEDQPIIGTTLDYFAFRGLTVSQGRQMAMLGECVLGAKAASALAVAVGGHVLSTPVGAFDVAGTYPLKMPVVGVLEPTETADDEAVFVDLKKTWVISGLAHGHTDVTQSDAKSGVLKREETNVVANASVLSYTEITAVVKHRPQNDSPFTHFLLLYHPFTVTVFFVFFFSIRGIIHKY